MSINEIQNINVTRNNICKNVPSFIIDEIVHSMCKENGFLTTCHGSNLLSYADLWNNILEWQFTIVVHINSKNRVMTELIL